MDAMASVITTVGVAVAVALVLAAGGGAAAASPARIGMPGCVTLCGGVDVPYPFGIGPDASCYLNQPGFNLTCDRSHDPARLLLVVSGGHLRIQYINDGTQSTLDVVRTIDLNTTGSDDLSLRLSGPFRPSSRGNELVLTGCNVRAALQWKTNKSTATTIGGCFSYCNRVPHQGPFADGLPRFSPHSSGASGGCCRTPISVDEEQYGPVARYSVELSWFGRNESADRAEAPARAFLAKDGWFDYWLSDYNNSQYATSLDAPVYLDYRISGSCGSNPCKSDHSDCNDDVTGGSSYHCFCESGYRGNAYVPGGCQVDDPCKQPQHITKCYGECTSRDGSTECKCPPGTHGNSAIPGGCHNSNLTRTAGKDNCTRLCGEVQVPYPFGIQDMGPNDCYHQGFNLTCDQTHNPPRLLLGDGGQFLVEKIDLVKATVHVVYPGAFANATSTHPERFLFRTEGFPSPDEVPYSLSAVNELVLTGCDVQAAMIGHRNASHEGADVLGGCVSLCGTSDFDEDPDVGNIVGRRRGQGRRRPSPNDKYCHGMGCCQAHISPDSTGGMPKQLGVAWLDYKSEFAEKTVRPALALVAEEGWFDNLGFSGMLGTDKQPPARAMQEVPIILQWEVLSDKPSSSCDAFSNICKSKHSECKQGDRGYTCHCKDGHHGNPYAIAHDHDQGCKAPGVDHRKAKIIGISVGVGLATAVGAIISVLIGRSISNKVRHQKAQMLKRKFFEQNRGQLLQQLVSQRADIAERMIIPLEELEKATNNFDKDRELGGGGHGTVYKGMLSDLHVVAIKKPKKVLQREIDEFINEVAILSQINHKNVVKLYGCCLETEVPMLVYEFIPNGTLYDHLHIDGPRSLSWEHRLRIAIETAKSLAYLHSTASVPIIHRDVKSVNILLDDTLTAKVADFGASRYISVEKSGLTTMVQGTIGYLDPMYFYTGRLTEKSDVYSYGVLLIELLTRKKPSSYLSSEDEGLVTHFVTLFEASNLSDILDPQVIDEGGKQVGEAAALAVACIKLRGEDRSTMRQVELTLESLRPTKEHNLDDGLEKDGIAKYSPLTIYGTSSEGSTRRHYMEVDMSMSLDLSSIV